MGLSFLKVAFATNPKYGVEYPVVIGAFAAGFALWSMYVDGVLPLGFPVRVGPQRGWLVAQLGLALGVTVAAVMAAFAVTAQRPAPRLAYARCGAAAAIAAVTVAAIVGGKLPVRTFSAALATLVVAAAAVDSLLRSRLRAAIKRQTRSWGRSVQAAPADPVTAARRDG